MNQFIHDLPSYFIIYHRYRMSSSTNYTEFTQKTFDFRRKYKTERCRYWYERGFCPFNQFCAFAHTDQELRGRNQFNQHYKTKICANFKNNGNCRYGDRCQFLHLREAPVVYNRSHDVSSTILQNLSEKLSVSSEEFDEKKHQKQLNILTDYGLQVLSMYIIHNTRKKGKRSHHWRSFLNDGVDVQESEHFGWDYFEQQFDEYDFKRKPRLGSM